MILTGAVAGVWSARPHELMVTGAVAEIWVLDRTRWGIGVRLMMMFLYICE